MTKTVKMTKTIKMTKITKIIKMTNMTKMTQMVTYRGAEILHWTSDRAYPEILRNTKAIKKYSEILGKIKKKDPGRTIHTGGRKSYTQS